MGRLYLGTCSWKFPSWQGLVYSAGRGIDYLAEYARRYDTVEIDQWFWSRFDLGQVKLPEPADVAAYRAAVGSGFSFTIKAPNSVTLTHLYRQEKRGALIANPSFLAPALMRTFLQLIEPLSDVLGPIMFQFEYLNRQKMGSQAAFQRQFGAFTQALPGGYEYALEVRNARYLNAGFFQFLRAQRLVPVLCHGYWMPPVWEVYEAHREAIAAHSSVVIRLLGPDRQDIEARTGKNWSEIVLPKDEELPQIAAMTHDLLSGGADVYINVNNHYEGSAPLTIERMRAHLRATGSN